MKQYLDLVKKVLSKGQLKPSGRSNMPNTLSIHNAQLRFDLQKGFPILTTKEVKFRKIVTELLWFLSGSSNIKYLIDNNCNIWNQDAYNYYLKFTVNNEPVSDNNNILYKETDGNYRAYTFEEFIQVIKNTNIDDLYNMKFKSINNKTFEPDYILGSCGKNYSKQWRNFGYKPAEHNNTGDLIPSHFGKDQIRDIIDTLLDNPFSRRILLTAWNPTELEETALHPCHVLAQFHVKYATQEERCKWVRENTDLIGTRRMMELTEWLDSINAPKYILDCSVYQRSCDLFLGVPFNITSYALLMSMLAKVTNMIAGELIWTGGDVHIYENLIKAAQVQLERKPKKLPKLIIDGKLPDNLIFKVTKSEIDKFKLENYQHDPEIKGKLSTGLR